MSEEELMAEAHETDKWAQNRFFIFISSSIVIAVVLVIISMNLYNSSGAAQLDLSRPGYRSVQDQASDGADFEGYPSTGLLDDTALNQFRTLYSEKAKEAVSVNGFDGDVLSDKALSIDDLKK